MNYEIATLHGVIGGFYCPFRGWLAEYREHRWPGDPAPYENQNVPMNWAIIAAFYRNNPGAFRLAFHDQTN